MFKFNNFCDEANPSGKTLLRIAVEHGLTSITQYILSLCSSPPPSHVMHVALGSKNRGSKLRMIVSLLENGLNVHAGAANGDPVLHTVMRSSCKKEEVLGITKILVDHGCNPLEACSSGKTSLQIAAERGFVSVARYLLSLSPPPCLRPASTSRVAPAK